MQHAHRERRIDLLTPVVMIAPAAALLLLAACGGGGGGSATTTGGGQGPVLTMPPPELFETIGASRRQSHDGEPATARR